MYDELLKRLRSEAVYLPEKFSKNAELLDVLMKAADAIEELATNYDAATDIMKHQTEYIEELEANKPRWIPVTERLPQDDTICILTNGISDAIGYRGKVFGWHLIWTDSLVESEVTHWMPLPQPPKEE